MQHSWRSDESIAVASGNVRLDGCGRVADGHAAGHGLRAGGEGDGADGGHRSCRCRATLVFEPAARRASSTSRGGHSRTASLTHMKRLLAPVSSTFRHGRGDRGERESATDGCSESFSRSVPVNPRIIYGSPTRSTPRQWFSRARRSIGDAVCQAVSQPRCPLAPGVSKRRREWSQAEALEQSI